MRMLFLLMFSAFISSPALAQARYHASPSYEPSYEAAPHYRPSAVRHPRISRDSNDVVFGGKVIGRDPDPWIREEILRHAESGWPD